MPTSPDSRVDAAGGNGPSDGPEAPPRLLGETQPWPVALLFSAGGFACAMATMQMIDSAAARRLSSTPAAASGEPLPTPPDSRPVVATQGSGVAPPSPPPEPEPPPARPPAVRPAATCAPAAHFRYASEAINPRESRAEGLRPLLAAMNRQPDTRAVIDAHANASGTHAFNLQLSHQRGERIAGWLRRAGIAASRISVRAFGEYQPTIDHDPLAAEQRRVVVHLERRGQCVALSSASEHQP
ncbi:MAG: OmpA family protein [Myxococcales bacterium FL481]|nr:MAG: OmpA family protein [Myxococcales bacterium FL481]